MTTPTEKPRTFRAVCAGTCVLTGQRFKAGADIYRCGLGYAKAPVAAAPKGWYYPEGEHELARAENVS